METLKRNIPLLLVSACFFLYFLWSNRTKKDELVEYKKEQLLLQGAQIGRQIRYVDSCFVVAQKHTDSLLHYTTVILNKSIAIIKAKTNVKIVKINSASHNELLRDLDSLRARNR